MATDSKNPHLFFSTSTSEEKPSLLIVSYEKKIDDSNNDKERRPQRLGAELSNCDQNRQSDMFLPGYATIHKVLDGPDGELARMHGVARGDCIVAVNGLGFRRFAPEYDDYSELVQVNDPSLSNNAQGSPAKKDDEAADGMTEEEVAKKKELVFRVQTRKDVYAPAGKTFLALTRRIQAIQNRMNASATAIATTSTEDEKVVEATVDDKKENAKPDADKEEDTSSSSNNTVPPIEDEYLELHLERHGWDSRANCMSRFFSAAKEDIVDCMGALQCHIDWKLRYFPIDLTDPILQHILQMRMIAALRPPPIKTRQSAAGGGQVVTPIPTIYIDYKKFQDLMTAVKKREVQKAKEELNQQNSAVPPESRSRNRDLDGSTEEDLLSDSNRVMDAIVRAFVIYTEILLAPPPPPPAEDEDEENSVLPPPPPSSYHPRFPKVNHFVDLSNGTNFLWSFPTEFLERVYRKLDEHYPETLHRVVLFPIPQMDFSREVGFVAASLYEHKELTTQYQQQQQPYAKQVTSTKSQSNQKPVLDKIILNTRKHVFAKAIYNAMLHEGSRKTLFASESAYVAAKAVSWSASDRHPPSSFAFFRNYATVNDTITDDLIITP